MSVKKIGKARYDPEWLGARHIGVGSAHAFDFPTPIWDKVANQLCPVPKPAIEAPAKEFKANFLGFGTVSETDESRAKYQKYESEKKGYEDTLELLGEKIQSILIKESDHRPLPLEDASGNQGKYFLYKAHVYKFDREDYSEEEVLFQIRELEDKERQKFEQLKRKFSLSKSEEEPQFIRERISEEVRIAVWRRDDGKCARCGGREKLEYDHILPISKGGSNTVRNIELLCEKCNRSKGAKIQ